MIETRRGLLTGLSAALLCGCSEPTQSRDAVVGTAPTAAPGPASPLPLDAPPLRSCAPFAVGTCVSTGIFSDPPLQALILKHFSQVTPEWEMKMERILSRTGALDFSAPDRIADFCRQNRLGLHATTLVWYDQQPDYFLAIGDDRARFEAFYRRYIATVVDRYKGVARGWDVLNEAVAENGNGYRGGIWERTLGPDYARIAFQAAHEADPKAVLFLNDYNLATMPTKLDAFQRLLEGLLQAGAPVGGIGLQSHLPIDIEKGAYGRAMAALARFGLPIHVSELTVSMRLAGGANGLGDSYLQTQARVMEEVAEAFLALPPKQRYAFTVWGVRDRDSFLRRGANAGDGADRPLLFDDEGRPKPCLFALEKVFAEAKT